MKPYDLAKQALETRMKQIGKTMDEIMPQEVHELCTLAVKDMTSYPDYYENYHDWMSSAVSSGGPGVLRLNI